MKGDTQVEGLIVVETDIKIADLTVVIEAGVTEEVVEDPTVVVVDEGHTAGTDIEAELLIEKKGDAVDRCLLRRHHHHPRPRRPPLRIRTADLVIRSQT